MSSRAADVQQSFQGFQREIDAYNDRRERLIKSSRDITTASKRLIFHLHRFPHQALLLSPSRIDPVGSTRTRGKDAERILTEGREKRDEIVRMIVQMAKRERFDQEFRRQGALEGDEVVEVGQASRYERATGSGLEEFVEAISFLHFLEHASLITLGQVQALFTHEREIIFPIPTFRYLLGLSDLTGELMRFATNAVGSGEASDVVMVVLNLIRDLRSGLDPFVPLIKDMKKKQVVTTQSMKKIEDVSYAIKVRSSEFASDPAALKEMLRRSLTSSARHEAESMDQEA